MLLIKKTCAFLGMEWKGLLSDGIEKLTFIEIGNETIQQWKNNETFSEAYSGLRQFSEVECFAKIVTSLKPLNIVI